MNAATSTTASARMVSVDRVKIAGKLKCTLIKCYTLNHLAVLPMVLDSRFRVELIAATPNPQQCIYAAMHQDYSEGFVCDERSSWPDETRAGEIAVKRLLAGDRGHFGCIEHAQITLNVGWFPHSVMQQARTHRVGISFDVQSMRYTGDRICKAAAGELELEEVFYLRPAGYYSDRNGKKYQYTEQQRGRDLDLCQEAASRYSDLILGGFAEEHARGILPFDYRQHFVVSFSLRAFLHFMDLRAKLDAQEEIRVLCDLMWPHAQTWAPEIAAWYEKNRLRKARLAP
jgi:thymidylate synthase (FAD)